MVIAGEWDRRAEGHGSTARWVNRCDMKHKRGNRERENMGVAAVPHHAGSVLAVS